jgi:hypothetical protein
MNLELKKKFRKETGLNVFVWDENNNIAYTEAYVEWLEKQIELPEKKPLDELISINVAEQYAGTQHILGQRKIRFEFFNDWKNQLNNK